MLGRVRRDLKWEGWSAKRSQRGWDALLLDSFCVALAMGLCKICGTEMDKLILCSILGNHLAFLAVSWMLWEVELGQVLMHDGQGYNCVIPTDD